MMQEVSIITGQSFLILRDLQNGVSIQHLSKLFNLTESSIYKLAKRNNIKLPERKLLSLEEKKLKKKILDSQCYKKKKLKNID